MKNLILFILTITLFTACSSKWEKLNDAGTNMEKAQALVKEGRVNEQTKYGATALDYALANNKISIAKYLLKNNALPKEHHLIRSVYQNRIKTTALLLEHGMDINIRAHDNGYNLLYPALEHGHIKMAKFLISKGIKVQYGLKEELENKHKDLVETYNKPTTVKQWKDVYIDYIKSIPIGLKFLETEKNLPYTDFALKKMAQNKKEKKQKELKAKNNKKLINRYIKQKNFKALKKIVKNNPKTKELITNKNILLLFTGPKDLMVGDIRELKKKRKNERLIISLIKRAKEPYKEFTLDEIDSLNKLGLSDNLISAMIDRTSELKKQNTSVVQKEVIREKVIYKTQEKKQNTLGDEIQKELVKEGAKKLLKSLF